MRIWANSLVCNEDRYIWFAIMSVIEQVDKILVWDTGSTDLTVSIIKEIKKLYPTKVEFKEVGEVTPDEFPKVRGRMLQESSCDWIVLVDGDEIWWDESAREIISLINKKGDLIETIVNRYINPVGDIFHFQDETAGMYEIDKFKGHLNIRAMNTKIPGLHVDGAHPLDAYFDEQGIPVQERESRKRFHLTYPAYLHLTHLVRSSNFDAKVPKRGIKFKYEIGNEFPSDFYYPEVFFRPRPEIVPNPWGKMTSGFFARALYQTPFKKFRRKFF